MSDRFEGLDRLLLLQARLERGPRREGAFALWLVGRVALDIGHRESGEERIDRRRVELLGQRLGSLALPRPLARGIAGALPYLQEATPAGARIALSQLTAPARDSLGEEAGDALAAMVRSIPPTGS